RQEMGPPAGGHGCAGARPPTTRPRRARRCPPSRSAWSPGWERRQGQRLGLPLALAPKDDAHPSAPARVLVCDAGFPLALLQAEGAQRFVARLAKTATFRRAAPPAYRGRGRPPRRGAAAQGGGGGAPRAGALWGGWASRHAARCHAELGGGGRPTARRGVARPGAAHRRPWGSPTDRGRPLRSTLSSSLAAGDPAAS